MGKSDGTPVPGTSSTWNFLKFCKNFIPNSSLSNLAPVVSLVYC